MPKKYLVSSFEEELHRYDWMITANTPEEAEEKMRQGDGTLLENKLISGEYVRAETGEIE